ncbi:antibiotic biosynthesis monooxygenase [Chryseobacterium sp. Leaf405]|uniref:antibiotic biosynthesis monooxygenase n=1 Tax=Chryseobacterium sp. Leaf405 TaxID=1736367 RepID=UPI000701ACB6|nr:antibiotic biosynthesis monooxygenase [Chryseobacterium sp. Leaf405]KQT33085.1 antibiotic biosynthesis monooxygenase [Chryseobacterium sp. Leaf405]
MPIHVAITRKVLPGKEKEFEAALQQFLGKSFTRDGVHGAMMITSLKEDGKNEIGILRTFKDEKEKNDFYNSELFRKWEEYASMLTEDTVYRDLTGLEAWFRSPSAPPRWKMALVTLCGVFPTSIFLNFTIAHWMKDWNVFLRIFIVATSMVGILTWIVMPFLTKVFKGWLRK